MEHFREIIRLYRLDNTQVLVYESLTWNVMNTVVIFLVGSSDFLNEFPADEINLGLITLKF